MQINKLTTAIETAFNVTNSIPVIAIPGATMRTAAAQIQCIAAAVFTLIGFIGQMIRPGITKWDFIFNNGCEHIMHGVLNYLRGVGELFLAVTIVGSLIPLAYQLSVKNGFAPIVKYDTSTLSQFKNTVASL